MVLEPEYELLITDDDPAFRETLRSVFQPHFKTREASCGEEAIEIIEHESVDLVLLDMHMHLLTGLETLKIVKTIKAFLPCIIITADATDELRREAIEANAFSLLQKPVRKVELVTVVASALQTAYPDRYRWQ